MRINCDFDGKKVIVFNTQERKKERSWKKEAGRASCISVTFLTDNACTLQASLNQELIRNYLAHI